MDRLIVYQDRNGVACPKCGTQCEFGLIVEFGEGLFHNVTYDPLLIDDWRYDLDNYEVMGTPKKLWCAVCGFEVNVNNVQVITVPDSSLDGDTECAACNEDRAQVARLMGMEPNERGETAASAP